MALRQDRAATARARRGAVARTADRIAYRLGYMHKSRIPRIEIDYGGMDGRPPHVLIEPAGIGSWRNRVVGYVFPALDDAGRGVHPYRHVMMAPNPIFTPARDEVDPT